MNCSFSFLLFQNVLTQLCFLFLITVFISFDPSFTFPLISNPVYHQILLLLFHCLPIFLYNLKPFPPLLPMCLNPPCLLNSSFSNLKTNKDMFLPGFTMGVLLSRLMKKIITYEPMYASKKSFFNFYIIKNLK